MNKYQIIIILLVLFIIYYHNQKLNEEFGFKDVRKLIVNAKEKVKDIVKNQDKIEEVPIIDDQYKDINKKYNVPILVVRRQMSDWKKYIRMLDTTNNDIYTLNVILMSLTLGLTSGINLVPLEMSHIKYFGEFHLNRLNINYIETNMFSYSKTPLESRYNRKIIAIEKLKDNKYSYKFIIFDKNGNKSYSDAINWYSNILSTGGEQDGIEFREISELFGCNLLNTNIKSNLKLLNNNIKEVIKHINNKVPNTFKFTDIIIENENKMIPNLKVTPDFIYRKKSSDWKKYIRRFDTSDKDKNYDMKNITEIKIFSLNNARSQIQYFCEFHLSRLITELNNKYEYKKSISATCYFGNIKTTLMCDVSYGLTVDTYSAVVKDYDRGLTININWATSGDGKEDGQKFTQIMQVVKCFNINPIYLKLYNLNKNIQNLNDKFNNVNTEFK